MGREKVELLLTMMDDRYLNDYWFLPMTQALEGVTAEQATWTPEGHANSIWQNVNHLTYWTENLTQRITGQSPSHPASNDVTFVGNAEPLDEAAWQETLTRFHQVYATLKETLEQMTDADVNKSISDTSVGRMVGNLLMHDAYHTGQIVFLRKLQGSWPGHR